MTEEKIPPEVEVVPARVQQKQVMENLFQYYLHDFSQYVDLELDDQGRFEDSHLPDYWQEENRYPFFITAKGNIAGFILVTRESKGDGRRAYDISEFFVLRGYRRQGVGKQAACKIWGRFPGSWQVRVMRRNQPAVAFWGAVIRGYAGDRASRQILSRGGYDWFVYHFENSA